MFHTPGKLQINLPVKHAFGLMAELKPKKKGIDVLKTTEVLKSFPFLGTYTVLVTLVLLDADLYQLAFLTVLATFISTLAIFLPYTSKVISLTFIFHKCIPPLIRPFIVCGVTFYFTGLYGLIMAFIAFGCSLIVYALIYLLIDLIFKITYTEVCFYRAVDLLSVNKASYFLNRRYISIKSEVYKKPLVEYVKKQASCITEDHKKELNNELIVEEIKDTLKKMY